MYHLRNFLNNGCPTDEASSGGRLEGFPSVPTTVSFICMQGIQFREPILNLQPFSYHVWQQGTAARNSGMKQQYHRL